MAEEPIAAIMQVANQKKWRSGALHVSIGSTGVGGQSQARFTVYGANTVELDMFVALGAARRLWRRLHEVLQRHEQPDLLIQGGTTHMIENQVHRGTDSVHVVDHCPGDATRYRCVACKLPRGVAAPTGNWWCVSFPDLGCASYYIEEGAHLSLGYIAEKFRGRGFVQEINEITAIGIGGAIKQVVPGVEVL